MQITLNIPNDLPPAKIQQAVEAFETRLQTEAIAHSDETKARRERFHQVLARLVELDPFADIDDPVVWQRELRQGTK